MSEITPTPSRGVITEFALFVTTKNTSEITPAPSRGAIVKFPLLLTTGRVTEIVPTPLRGEITKLAWRNDAHRHIGLVRGARGVG